MKCRFRKKCELYDNLSNTCNKTGGKYYSEGYCGKYRKFLEDEKNK